MGQGRGRRRRGLRPPRFGPVPAARAGASTSRSSVRGARRLWCPRRGPSLPEPPRAQPPRRRPARPGPRAQLMGAEATAGPGSGWSPPGRPSRGSAPGRAAGAGRAAISSRFPGPPARSGTARGQPAAGSGTGSSCGPPRCARWRGCGRQRGCGGSGAARRRPKRGPPASPTRAGAEHPGGVPGCRTRPAVPGGPARSRAAGTPQPRSPPGAPRPSPRRWGRLRARAAGGGTARPGPALRSSPRALVFFLFQFSG